jgi:glucosamine--fructose-6-phosphate aminotransferase (isomerizing)
VHNGIVENHAQLRTDLESAGVEMASETDTEVVAHLVGRHLAAHPEATVTEALREASQQLVGSFTLVAVDREDPDRVAACRRNSPLVVGVGDGEMFLGSDVAAFIAHTRDAVELGQDQVVEITRDGYSISAFDGTPAEGTPRQAATASRKSANARSG